MPSQIVSHKLILTFAQLCVHIEAVFSMICHAVCKVCGEYSLK